jgi:hypothetical protein
MASEIQERRQRQGEVPLFRPMALFCRLVSGWTLVLGLVSCEKPADRELSTPPPPEPAGDVERTESRAVPIAEPEPLKVGRRLEYRMGQDLLGPFPEKLARSEIETRAISLTEKAGPHTWLSIDDHAPRRVRGKNQTVSDLLNEDVELAPGGHRLTVFTLPGSDDQTASGQIKIQAHDFFIDVEPGGQVEAIGCIAFTPELTKNGPVAAQVLSFWAIPLIWDINRVSYEVRGPNLHRRSEAEAATEMILEAPPNGDLSISVRCFANDREQGYDTQVVTINADAPNPEKAE